MRNLKRFLVFAFLLCIPLYVMASVTVTVNGTNHTIPQTNERGWGNSVTTWIQAISQYSLQPTGGNFVLTNDVNFGGTYGLKSQYFATRTANPSTAGLLRLSKTDVLGWRNNANSNNLLLGIDGSDNLTFNGVIVPTLNSGAFKDNGFSIVDNSDATKQLAFDVAGSTGTKTTIATSQTTNRTWTIPDATDTAVGKNTVDAFTNKTYDVDATGNVLSNIANANVKNGAAIAYSKLNLTGSITSGDISVSAAIPYSKMEDLTASRAVVTNASGDPTATTTTATEIGYVNGVTSSLCGINQSCTLSNKTFTYPIVNDTFSLVDQGSDPATPASGYKNYYSKSAGIFYRNSAGTVYQLANLNEAQIFTNKDYDGGTASNSSRNTLPKAAKATLSGLTRKEATLVYASDEDKVYADDGSTLKALAYDAGSKNVAYQSISTSQTVSVDYDVYAVNSASGDVTVTLPTLASSLGKVFTIKKTDSSANKIIIDGNSTEQVEGGNDFRLYNPNDTVKIANISTSWVVLSSSIKKEAAQFSTGTTGYTCTANTWITAPLSNTSNSTMYPLSSNTFTIRKSATYRFTMSNSFISTNGETGYVTFSVNGASESSNYINGYLMDANASGSTSQITETRDLGLSAGDVIRLRVQMGTNTRSCNNGRFEIQEL